MPYTCDFESAVERSQWTFRNGTQANKWHVGTATDNGGQYSLYVSCDSGLTHTYDATVSSYVWACRQIFLNTGLYNISYDWKGQGCTNVHYMRAYIVPATSFNGSAGSSNGFQTSGFPNGWIPIDASYPVGSILNQQNTWQNVSVGYLSVSAAGNYYIVFGWTNHTDTTAVDPPAAVDNIQITAATCVPPANLSVIPTSAQGFVCLTWEVTVAARMWLLEYSADSTFLTGVISMFLDLSRPGLCFAPQRNLVTLLLHAGLQPNTPYYFRMRTLCDTSVATGDTSAISNVFAYIPVGIRTQAEQADVALYPNPASDRIFVQFDGTEADEICLFDIYGKQVKRVAASQGANSIGVQNFARGIYFVQVRKNGTVVATRKLIKK